MALLDALNQGLEQYGIPTKKERIKSGTPLKHFLRPIIEESVRRRMMETMQRAPQLSEGEGAMVEPPSISPLQNALMSVPQGGAGGSTTNQHGGVPSGP